MPRRRRRKGPPRCQYCHSPITFLLTPKRSRYRPFNPRPVAPNTPGAYPVMSRKAWDPNELLAELEGLRKCDTTAAAAEVNDMPWHQIHLCGEALAAWKSEREQKGAKT